MNKALAAGRAVARPAVAAAAIATALVACSADEARKARARNPAPCPNVIVLQDASRLIEFDAEDPRDASAQTLQNVAWSGEFLNASLSCRYFSDKPIEARLDLSMAFGRGPAADGREKTFQYFVAVTRTNREVIAKETFDVPVKFDRKGAVKVVEDEVDEIRIPRAAESIAGQNFEVVVGLVLTPDQAIYNRSGRSLKFPRLGRG